METGEGTGADLLRGAGDRIETLLDACSAQGPVARARAEELLRVVTDLYGAGLERALSLLHEAGRLDGPALAALTGDDLVASLLLVHGLHPEDVATRAARGLAAAGPALAAQGVTAELAGVLDGVVTVRLGGQTGGCGVAALTRTVEEAVQAAAPDAEGVRVELDVAARGPSLIPVDALRSRLTRAAP